MSSKLIVNTIENTTGTHSLDLDGGSTSLAGDLTVGGAFTSQGIDDNATSTAMTIDSAGKVSLNTAPATLEYYVASFTQTSNTYSTLHTFTAPAAGHYLFTISASLGSAVYGKLELTDGSTTLLSANWGYDLPHYSLYRTGLITLDGSTDVLFRGARNDGGSSVTMRGVQAYAVRLG